MNWILQTEPTFDIGIFTTFFITLILTFIGSVIRSKKNRKVAEERFKAIEKQISLQKEIEKEMYVRKQNVKKLKEVEIMIFQLRKKLNKYIDDVSENDIENLDGDNFSISNLYENLEIQSDLIYEKNQIFDDIIFYTKKDEEFYKSIFDTNIFNLIGMDEVNVENVLEKIKSNINGMKIKISYDELLKDEEYKELYNNQIILLSSLSISVKYLKKYEISMFKKDVNIDVLFKELQENNYNAQKNQLKNLKIKSSSNYIITTTFLYFKV